MSINPQVYALFFRAQNSLSQARADEARQLLIRALSISSGFPPAWHLLADTYSAQGRNPEAIKTLKRALKTLAKDQAAQSALQIHLASLLLKEDEVAEAVSTIDLPSLQRFSNWRLLSRAGYLLMLCEEHQLALSAYKSARAINDQDPELLFNSAVAHGAMGDLKTAEKMHDQVIAISTRHYPAYKLRSDLKKQTPDNNHIEELTRLTLDTSIPDEAKVHNFYALAKELEDLREYGPSFARLAQGAAIKRKSLNYDVNRDLELLQAVADTYNNSLLSREISSSKGEGIIFVLGMPRTGSTLIDRILSSTNKITSAGEPNTFARLLYTSSADKLEIDLQNGSDLTELLKASANINFASLGEEYERKLLARAHTKGTKYIIDKNPANFLYIGAIHLALPKAKIIHIARDPMDTCYAIYKALFKDGHPYSYDLAELGNYYCGYRQLMRHWSKEIPNTFYEIQYEDLIENPKQECLALFEYCELEWQDSCLEFYRNKASGTATASTAQVRNPIYKSSLGKWKNYQEQLKPLRQILEKLDEQ
ncbi:tetratricopeptide repeat-containing sulfotransferase family protein [Microbulbifer taiwanensis]|uniref:Tetratricopeptide repeat-containing sulfotransferase family protein n=1 Tax=Microbulbifer taiwanensis TaxID=986746 RepID=A0ABW1YTN0_9GAMM|nr:sulfotransferase [Microbulbifer taiwanensis]